MRMQKYSLLLFRGGPFLVLFTLSDNNIVSEALENA